MNAQKAYELIYRMIVEKAPRNFSARDLKNIQEILEEMESTCCKEEKWIKNSG